ncbi:MAG: hypothetical protein M1320_02040 [Patescibacteria group bacterium]|nr:hypothetical protein [Patescibacteria group bacterium]
MNPLNKRIIFVLGSFALLVGAVFVYSSFIKPAYTDIASLRSELFAKRELYVKYQNSINQLKSMIQAGQDVNQIRDIAQRILPQGLDVSQVVAQLTGFARLNRVSIMSLGTQAQPTRAPLNAALQSVGVVETAVHAQGGYNDLKLMFGQLENNLLVLDATRIQLNRIANNGVQDTQKLDVTYTIRSYYQSN